eukprot:scaffold10547_cov268-Chaetoceros_neogracile.AAC.7
MDDCGNSPRRRVPVDQAWSRLTPKAIKETPSTGAVKAYARKISKVHQGMAVTYLKFFSVVTHFTLFKVKELPIRKLASGAQLRFVDTPLLPLTRAS